MFTLDAHNNSFLAIVTEVRFVSLDSESTLSKSVSEADDIMTTQNPLGPRTKGQQGSCQFVYYRHIKVQKVWKELLEAPQEDIVSTPLRNET